LLRQNSGEPEAEGCVICCKLLKGGHRLGASSIDGNIEDVFDISLGYVADPRHGSPWGIGGREQRCLTASS
jgi:hypothetical protein